VYKSFDTEASNGSSSMLFINTLRACVPFERSEMNLSFDGRAILSHRAFKKLFHFTGGELMISRIFSNKTVASSLAVAVLSLSSVVAVNTIGQPTIQDQNQNSNMQNSNTQNSNMGSMRNTNGAMTAGTQQPGTRCTPILNKRDPGSRCTRLKR
jgi:hypothetical protein